MKMYRDFYGCVAAVRPSSDGGARLTVRTAQGALVHEKDYKTERGALAAMGRLSDGWSRVQDRKGAAVCQR